MFSKESFSSNEQNGIVAMKSSAPPVAFEHDKNAVPHNVDKAYAFLQRIDVSAEEAMGVNLAALRRRIDFRLIPFLFLCYTMAWLDKALMNYANVMGISKDLELEGNEFSNVNTFFYVALTLAELPTGLILNKISARTWLGINVILWGAATCAVAGSTGYESLLATRILVGLFEAAVAPCLLLLVSQWYTKSEQAPRYAVWYCGLGAGQIIGSLESYGFQFVKSNSFQGWRIMFVLMGGITILIGIVVLLFQAENPINAKWLRDVEKAALLNHISVNKTGVLNRHFNSKQLIEAFLDVQTYMILSIMVLFCIPSAITTSYGATLLSNFGYTTKEAALLGTGNGAVSIITALVSGFGVRKTSNRWAWIVGVQTPGIIGACLYSFVPKSNKTAVLAGLYLANTSTAAIPLVYQWTAANVAGNTKRGFVMGLVTAAFGAGSAVGPQLFQAKDKPLYKPARVGLLSVICVGCFLVCLLASYYKFENMRRNKRQARSESNGDASISDEEKWGNLTDKENPSFRYVL